MLFAQRISIVCLLRGRISLPNFRPTFPFIRIHSASHVSFLTFVAIQDEDSSGCRIETFLLAAFPDLYPAEKDAQRDSFRLG